MLTSHPAKRPRKIAAALVCAAATVGLYGRARTLPASQPVSLYVTVEEKGGLVRGLGKSNFRLYEDGDPRPFELAKPETPSEIALLVEFSQSSWIYFNDIQTAMAGFLDAAPEGNWYAFATFSHGLQVQVDFTKQAGKIREAFGELSQPMWDEVDTYDAVYDMLDKMERLPGRRVLIVICSGQDTFSAHTLGDVQKKIEEANVVVYSAGVGSLLRGMYEPYLGTLQRMNMLSAQSFLTMLADQSGGEAWFPNQEGAFPDIMKGIMQSLASQYRLVYVPQVPADGKLHKIKVEAFQITNDKRHDFKVRVREGWRL